MRDDPERLRDILDAIQEVELYAARGKDTFEQERLIQTWIVHHLMIMGEAASRVSAPVRDMAPNGARRSASRRFLSPLPHPLRPRRDSHTVYHDRKRPSSPVTP